jgi:hypothetical protein
MNPWLPWTLLLSGVCVWFGRRLPVSFRLAPVVLGLCGVPGALFLAYYTHWFDTSPWYCEYRSWPGIELSAALMGVPTGWVCHRVARPWLWVAASVLLAALVVAPHLKPFLVPLDTARLVDRWQDGVCLQSTASTCGPSCAATLLRGAGLEASERDLALECHTYGGGTEIWYVARALRRRGLTVQFRFCPELPYPSVAGVRLGQAGHFITVLERQGDRYRIGDPLRGAQWMDMSELTHRYQLTGFYLVQM